MSYLQALEQKGLKKEDLAKQTQKKIEDLEYRKAQIEEDADDYDEEDLNKILGMIKKIDAELEKSILKFNPEVYKKRVEVFERNKKLAREQEQQEEEDDYVDFSNDNDDEQVEVEKVQPQVQQQVQQAQQVAKPQPQQEVAKPQQVVKEEPKKELNERLDELKEEVQTNTEKFNFEKEERTHRKIEVEEEGEEVEVEEIEDYKNKGSIKPKKMSTSVLIMALGFGLLTFGAVNFFRERR
jgi:hypothetical protein